VNKIAFISKSADPDFVSRMKARNVKEDVVKYVELKTQRNVIFWIGEFNEEYVNLGKKLGYDCRKYVSGDPSILLKCFALVVMNAGLDFYKKIATLNFASTYGIPIIWLNDFHHPGRWIWYFNLCLVGDLTPVKFWRLLCQKIT